MRPSFFSRRTRYPLFSVLLLAVALRALVPVGYMPSAERPFTLQLCPDSFPVQFLAPAHHSHIASDEQSSPPATEDGSHRHSSGLPEHCLFGAAFSAAAPPHVSAIAVALEPWAVAFFDTQLPILVKQRHRVQQPRAPPTLS